MKKSPVFWSIAGLFCSLFITSTSGHLLAQATSHDEITPIYKIQGSGTSSPLYQEWIDTAGQVTGVTDNGYYLQDVSGESAETTSSGIFVYTQRKPTVAVGDCVLLNRAFVDEYYEKTELSRAKSPVAVNWCDDANIEPVPIPAARLASAPAEIFEQYEGMLVQIDDLTGVVHGPTKRFNNGEAEIAFVPEGLQAYIDGERVFQHVAQDTSALQYVSSALGLELPDLNRGDRIAFGPDAGPNDSVVGILDYNFGKYQFMPLPSQEIDVQQIVSGPDDGSQSLTEPAGTQDFTVCTFNLLSLGSGTAQYKDDYEYESQLRKRALAIAERLGGCTIIAAQEAGEPQDAENLALYLDEKFEIVYEATAIEGPGTNSSEFPLTNAILTRSDRVSVLDASLRQGCSRFNYDVKYEAGVCERGTYALFNRPPLVVDLVVDVDEEAPYYLTVINNHWKSKGGDETVNVVRRQAQAEHVASLVQEKLDDDPNAQIIVLGDLNDYYRSATVETLRTGIEPNLVHAYDFLPELDRYTYIFNGASQVLDHILVTANMSDHMAEIQPVRLNADYAYPLTLDAESVQHSSDHDPVVVRIRPDNAAWLGDNLGFGDIETILAGEDGEVISSSTTDAHGEFRLWNLVPGEYVLTLMPPPWVEIDHAEMPIEIEAGQNSVANVNIGHVGITIGIAAAVNELDSSEMTTR